MPSEYTMTGLSAFAPLTHRILSEAFSDDEGDSDDDDDVLDADLELDDEDEDTDEDSKSRSRWFQWLQLTGRAGNDHVRNRSENSSASR